MVSALNSGASSPGSSPGRGHCELIAGRGAGGGGGVKPCNGQQQQQQQQQQ